MRAARAVGCSSLCHPGFHRQGDRWSRSGGRSSPAVQSKTVRATPSSSRVSEFATTPNRTGRIDMENPFIPSRSRICRVADIALIFGVVIAGLVAVIAAVCNQMQGAGI